MLTWLCIRAPILFSLFILYVLHLEICGQMRNSTNNSTMVKTFDPFLQCVPIMANNTSQQDIDNALSSMQTWNTTLPISGVLGNENVSVNLFQYIDPSCQCWPGYNSPIKFDPDHYLPSEEGLNTLMIDLKRNTLQHGPNLINQNNWFTLSCF